MSMTGRTLGHRDAMYELDAVACLIHKAMTRRGHFAYALS